MDVNYEAASVNMNKHGRNCTAELKTVVAAALNPTFSTLLQKK